MSTPEEELPALTVLAEAANEHHEVFYRGLFGQDGYRTDITEEVRIALRVIAELRAERDRMTTLASNMDGERKHNLKRAEAAEAEVARLSEALAESTRRLKLFWNAIDIMNDGPDDSDVAMAQGNLAEAMNGCRSFLYALAK